MACRDDRGRAGGVRRHWDLLRSGYARSQAIRNNALGFLMTTFQKLNSSSRTQSVSRCFGESSGSKLASPFRMEGDAIEEDDSRAGPRTPWAPSPRRSCARRL